MCCVVVPLLGVLLPPVRFLAFWVSWAFCPLRPRCGSPFSFGVFLMVSLSLSGASSFARASVVVASVAWCPASRSILVSSACGLSFVCRVRGQVVAGRGLWSALVASRKAGVPVVLGFRAGWGRASAAGSFWFDAVAVVPAAVESPSEVAYRVSSPLLAPAARLATAWGVPVPA